MYATIQSDATHIWDRFRRVRNLEVETNRPKANPQPRLNLAAASQVHILEPHWNPMVEEQAAARVHRLDQTEEVSIFRYIVKDSIEENIQKMQRRKRWYASLSHARDMDDPRNNALPVELDAMRDAMDLGA